MATATTPTIAPAAGARPACAAWLQAVLDRPLTSYHLVLGSASMLLALGLMMVLSASSVSAYLIFDDSYYYVKRQAMFLVVGVVGAVALVAAAAQRAPGARLVRGGAGHRAADLDLHRPRVRERRQPELARPRASPTIQPSEFAKLAMIIWGADVLARKDKLLDQPRHLLFPTCRSARPLILLVVFQGDAGTAVVMASIMVGVLFIVGTPIRVLAALGLLAIGGVVTLVRHQPGPDAAAGCLPGPDRRPQRGQRPGQRRHVGDRLRRLVGSRTGRQPAEVGRAAGRALRLHLRRDRGGARACSAA